MTTSWNTEGDKSLPAETLKEVGYSILFLFMNGPLKVWLEIKEGRTSIKKLVEDYEDERTIAHTRLGVKKPDLLPT